MYIKPCSIGWRSEKLGIGHWVLVISSSLPCFPYIYARHLTHIQVYCPKSGQVDRIPVQYFLERIAAG
ncbi:MAG: hypothetical protein HWQ23_27010 [Nostoc sp. JL33]|nr:hypothetical protein [Nostoc sp. JL33]